MVDSLELFDDGNHGDSTAGDGIFANYYRPSSEQDLIVEFHIIDTRHYYEGGIRDWFGISTIPFERIGDILLINDLDLMPPMGEMNATYYKRGLNRLGYGYFFWPTYFRGLPTTTELREYLRDGAVIWAGPTSLDRGTLPQISYQTPVQETVALFLDQGGRLLLAGNSIGEMSQFYPLLLRDYIHARYIQTFHRYAYLETLNGVGGDPIGDGLNLDIIGKPGISQYFAEEIDPTATALSIFYYDTTSGPGQIQSSGSGAVRYESDGYRTIFFSFDLSGITDSTLLDSVLSRSVRWLIGHGPGISRYPPEKNRILIRPNPGNPFLIGLSRPDTVSVFDLSGRRIDSLWVVDRAIWRAPRPGIYFLRVRDQVRKVVVIR
ncbi:hypothetical protein DRP53_05765 [candidate division WOR-3 bacterium]|uniref:Uncharacterized protein n=1 Tax=candidate division WOR-3 bacterium TaxID=2052148 RepID=A0A660SHC8_UNCW3|nr:MAG: hypothetical protein DRP53_05765 [candidate division WOR-3 bacterium]